MPTTTKPVLLKKRKLFFKQYTDITVDYTLLTQFEEIQIRIINNALRAILENMDSNNEALGIKTITRKK